MKVASAWSDAVIHNVSSRGLLAAAEDAPAPGTYLEIRRGTNIIVGRVMWRKDRFFGVRTQDAIDLAALSAAPQRRDPRAASAPARGPERRGMERLGRDVATARRLERNRELSRLFQFVVLGSAAIAAGVAVAYEAFVMLAAPLRQASAAMAIGG
ncbi:hypothetical protein [uncultured Sphingomonas sp.]|uniref:hypothetical protein n=1 Tax=uncultured Sphingomonas sp. TaxID=158754 RepID=UPI0035CB007D